MCCLAETCTGHE
uniref:Uncharacterized protein n=1 Tax=Anopheles minimus TaxID=112268 RepID=A0A182WPR5_9DIPT